MIKDGKPQLRIREKPFDADDWNSLTAKTINPIEVINYNLSKSIDEVYTVFYSYVEGSPLSPDFYNKLYATKDGYDAVNTAKQKIYGYKPMQCNFVGFNIEKYDDDKVTNSMKNKISFLNNRMAKWYGNLDEMYKAVITCIQISGYEQAKPGDKIKFLDGEFYVTGTDHSWSYEAAPKITYHCERGGYYNNGDFAKLNSVSRPMAEFNNGN